ncbi:Fumonisin B1 esterase (plasmid) [Brevundimonas subvibrioides]|uniref:carboxylesterase/lipase family protein n=1 Tax=Brevundimonas subvibrioides TaxID=74313 RepID=UPI0032D58C0E
MRRLAIAFGMAMIVLSTGQAQAQLTTAPVSVTGGSIIGAEKDGLRTYFGVPFAAPPVGNLRWRAPQAVVPWKGVKTATEFSAACAQKVDWIASPKSEDCLYLNIWSPQKATKLPVLVWIHGGAYEGGTAAVPVQNGANLAKRGAIVVTLNYRLGIFGFFSHPELSKESPQHVSGNQGILDQVAALKWIKANIAKFGGDPERVTIMGGSSGAESVAILVSSPLGKGLFQRAVAESGNDAFPINPSDTHRFNSKVVAEANGVTLAKAAGAEHLADLRKLSVKDLQAQTWLPRVYVDGYVLTSDMTTLFQKHLQNDVPLLAGWTAEEGKDLAGIYLGTNEFTAAKHVEHMTSLLSAPPSQALLAAYPGATDAEATASIQRLTNDWWGWRTVHWAELQAKYGHAKPYVYYFAHRPTEPATTCYWACGAGHGVELQYLFDNLDVDARNWSQEDRQLATQLADTVVQFAKTGRPNSEGLPTWPEFDGSKSSIRIIGNEAELKAHPLPDFSVFLKQTD